MATILKIEKETDGIIILAECDDKCHKESLKISDVAELTDAKIEGFAKVVQDRCNRKIAFTSFDLTELKTKYENKKVKP